MDLGIISIILSIVGAALVLVGLFISFPLESEVGMIFIISGFIALLVALLMSPLTTSTEKYDICSVKTQSEYSSCFFLGTGGAEKDDYYYFYRINKKMCIRDSHYMMTNIILMRNSIMVWMKVIFAKSSCP